MEQTCPRCNSRVKSTAIFCPTCGRRLRAPASVGPTWPLSVSGSNAAFVDDPSEQSQSEQAFTGAIDETQSRRVTTIAVGCQKGGVAKTTTAITLAHGLAERGHKTLLVDLDPQGHCALALGFKREPGIYNLLVHRSPLNDVMRKTGRPRLLLLPGDSQTAVAQSTLTMEGTLNLDVLVHRLHVLIKTDIEYVIIDTPPTIGGLQQAALFAAQFLVIPASVDYLSAEAVGETLASMKEVNAQGSMCRLAGVIPTFYDSTRETMAVVTQLQEMLGPEAILPPIHRAVIFRESAAEGKTIFEYAPSSRAAEEGAALVHRVMAVAKEHAR